MKLRIDKKYQNLLLFWFLLTDLSSVLGVDMQPVESVPIHHFALVLGPRKKEEIPAEIIARRFENIVEGLERGNKYDHYFVWVSKEFLTPGEEIFSPVEEAVEVYRDLIDLDTITYITSLSELLGRVEDVFKTRIKTLTYTVFCSPDEEKIFEDSLAAFNDQSGCIFDGFSRFQLPDDRVGGIEQISQSVFEIGQKIDRGQIK